MSPRLSQVPVRMSIVKLSGGGLFILNPIAATRELLDMVHELEKQHGPVKHVVLSTVAIEHKAYAGVSDLGVPRCCGAFTPSTRVVSRRGGRGWSVFGF